MCAHKRFVFILLIIAAAGAVFAQQEEWYQGKPIKDIVFIGLYHVSAPELEGLMEPYRGRPFDDSIFWEIQGKLYALEYFDLITPSAERADSQGNEVIIRFTVTERPVIRRINFVGNSGVRRNELLDTISIKVNDVINQAKIRVDEQAIINKYIEKGYPDITVRSETQSSGESSIVLTFYITEGEKITIREFRFEGNSVFSDRTLRGQLSLKTKGLLNDGAFQEAKLLADRAAVAQYYHDRGYIDAEVIDITREVARDAKGNNNMILSFRIHEGQAFTFGEVIFEGNHIFSTEQLGKLIRTKPGETISARKLEADFQRLADLYYENGYIFNTIGREEIRDTQARVISYHILIVERGRAHIENIIIQGNIKTKTEVILREIPLEPGDVFSKTKVMEAWRNLMNLQFFSAVVPDTPPGSIESLMDLVFIVEEQPTTNLQFGLTFSGSADPETFPISLMFQWNDLNLRGSGNQLGADVTYSPDTTNVSLNYSQRWIFGLPLSGGFDFTFQWNNRLAALNNGAGTMGEIFNGDELWAYPDGFSSRAEYEAANQLPPSQYLMDYEQLYLSLGFSTGYRWTTFLGNLSLGGGIRFGLLRNNYDNTLYRPFDPTLRDGNNRWTPRNSLWTNVSLDRRDLFYDPSNGFYLAERFGIYGIFGDLEREHYLRNDARAEYFMTLFDIPVTEKWNFKSVLGFHTSLALIFKQPGRNRDSLIPKIEEASKLSLDGMFNARGWSSEYRVKGLVLWENWAELRFPLIPGILAWDFFFDAATIETRQGYYFQGYSFESMRFSFGGGLRFTLPQFPFRFSFAKRFRIVDDRIHWEKGTIPFGPDGPGSGIDPVISFVLSY